MKTYKQIIGALGALALMAGPTQAALNPLGGEFPLLGDLPGHQKNPDVALGETGGFVVWQNLAGSANTERVMVQRLGPDMTGAGVPFAVGQSARSWNELSPQVAMLPDGGAVVIWTGGARADNDVYARVLNASGSFTTGDILINTTTAGHQRDAALTVLSNGNVAVVWSSTDQDGDGEGVYGQLLAGTGARIGGEVRINQTTAMNQSSPSVAALKDGKYVIAWVSEEVKGKTSAGAPNLRSNVMGRVIGADGAGSGNEYKLNEGDVLGANPALASGEDGSFTLAWEQRDEKNTRNLEDIYLRVFNADGVAQGGQIQQNTFHKGQQEAPALVSLDGEGLVAWTSYGQDASGGGIEGRMASGGKEFQVNSQGNLHQTAPTLGTDGQSKFLAVWVNTIAANHSILSAQRYLSSDSSLGGTVDVTDGAVQIVDAEDKGRAATPVASAAAAKLAAQRAAGITISGVDQTSYPINTSPAPAIAAAPRAVATVAPAIAPAASVAAPSASAAARAALSSAAQMRQPASARINTGASVASRTASLAPKPAPATRTPTAATRPAATARPAPSATAAARLSTVRTQAKTSSAAAKQTTPVSASLVKNGGGNALQWNGQSGAKYQVQGSSDLKAWNNVGTSQSGAGRALSAAVGADGARYYRVVKTN